MSEYSIEEASKLLENDKFSLQEKYEICLKLKQFDRAKKYLLKIKEFRKQKKNKLRYPSDKYFVQKAVLMLLKKEEIKNG